VVGKLNNCFRATSAVVDPTNMAWRPMDAIMREA
jgi:hypothetical protein